MSITLLVYCRNFQEKIDMSVYTTEIASDQIVSDNPLHQRLLFPYHESIKFAKGKILELGCGEGRGAKILHNISHNYTGVDKISQVIETLRKKYNDSSYNFICDNIPPLKNFNSDSFDTIVAFQVIEHIKDDELFLKEIHRVLKPGGIALITTPNIKKTLSRNPWHIREYTSEQLKTLGLKFFPSVKMFGIGGNHKVWKYYEENKISVQRIMRWDFLDLQHKLPASILRLPYEVLNRMNRNNLNKSQNKLVVDISFEDYHLDDDSDKNLDLFMVCYK
ncbi:MAG: methyltransferase domain-containing protein [Cytophagales bacterium]